MTNFSQKARFDLADYLSRPATAAEIKRATDARKKHQQFMADLKAERAKAAPQK